MLKREIEIFQEGPDTGQPREMRNKDCWDLNEATPQAKDPDYVVLNPPGN